VQSVRTAAKFMRIFLQRGGCGLHRFNAIMSFKTRSTESEAEDPKSSRSRADLTQAAI